MKSHGSNNKRKDGFFSTSKVHIANDGTVEKLKLGTVNNKLAYFKVKDNSVVPKNKTCFKNQVVDGRVSKVDYDDDEYSNSTYREYHEENHSHYQDSNGDWQHTADGW